MKEILLTQGKVALVDDDDYEYLSQFNWHVYKSKHSNTFYAKRAKMVDGKKTHIKLHHEILGIPEKGFMIDHKDHNGLNNQRENIHFVTNRQNQMNRCDKNECLSKYPGVSMNRHRSRFRVDVMLNKKRTYLGSFIDELEAAITYMKAVYGENYLYE